MLLKLSAVKKFVALKLKKTTMSTKPMTMGSTPRLPVFRLSSARRQSPASAGTSSPSGSPMPGAATSISELTRRSSGAVSAIPATLVGMPAVIASHDCCCVVDSRS